jgi:hypothetical protein
MKKIEDIKSYELLKALSKKLLPSMDSIAGLTFAHQWKEPLLTAPGQLQSGCWWV